MKDIALWVICTIIFFAVIFWIVPGYVNMFPQKDKVCFSQKTMFSFITKTTCLNK